MKFMSVGSYMTLALIVQAIAYAALGINTSLYIVLGGLIVVFPLNMFSAYHRGRLSGFREARDIVNRSFR